MFGVLVSAFNTILAFVIRSAIIKFVLYFGLFFVTTEFISVLSSMLPGGDGGLAPAFSGLSPGVWWFLDMMQAGYGVSAVVSAWVTRFIIRRVPIIG